MLDTGMHPPGTIDDVRRFPGGRAAVWRCEELAASCLRGLRIGATAFRAMRGGMTAADAFATGYATAAFREMSRPRATAFLRAMGDDMLAAGRPDQALALYRK